eukprot:751572-Hanusia_phi.AAC.3
MKHPVCKTFEEAMDVVNSSQHQVLEMHSHCCFTENNLTPLCQGIRTNRNLVVLILGGLGLKGSAGRELGRALRTHPVLQELHLHNNKLGYEGVQLLSEELASSKQTNEAPNRELKVLVLRNNDIGRHCISSCNLCRFSPDFPSGLLQVTCLHVIDLNANRIEILPLQLALMPNVRQVGVGLAECLIRAFSVGCARCPR